MSIFGWGKRGGGGDEDKGREEGEREVEHVTDPTRIAAYGVMSTPALVVRGRVVAYGRVLTKEEALKILKESLENPL